MAKPNYRHAKKQKEAARKARQDAKAQRRAHAPETVETVQDQGAPAQQATPVKTDS